MENGFADPYVPDPMEKLIFWVPFAITTCRRIFLQQTASVRRDERLPIDLQPLISSSHGGRNLVVGGDYILLEAPWRRGGSYAGIVDRFVDSST